MVSIPLKNSDKEKEENGKEGNQPSGDSSEENDE